MADHNKLVLSELLAYVSTYIGKSGEFNLRMAVLQHYDVDEITSARSIMEANVKELIPNYPNFGKKRTDSVNRTAKEVMVNDITEMFKMLDKLTDRSGIPVFVAADLSKLPPAAPETAADIMSVLETLARQERRIAQLQETMTATRKDVEKNRDDIREVLPKLAQVSETNADVTGKPEMSRSMSSVRPTSQASAIASGSRNEDAVMAPPATYSAAAKSVSQRVTNAKGKSEECAIVLEESGEQAKEDEKSGGFRASVKRPNKGSNKGLGASRTKPPRSSGTGDSDRLRAGPKAFQMQITNVGSDVNIEDIKEYIKSSNDGSIEAQNVEDMTGEHWDTKRFVITFDYKHLNTVNEQGFWPKNIYFKRWFAPKAKTS